MSQKRPTTKDRAMHALPVRPRDAAPAAPATEASPAVDHREPKTAPGVMMRHLAQQSAAIQENEDLKAQLAKWDGALPVQELDTSLIDDSAWANRHEDNFSAKAFLELKGEIEAAKGNVQPIKVRPHPTQPGRFEVVYGHRRLRACRELGLPVKAMVEALKDQDLFLQMERENRMRKDLRPYEQGLMYLRALEGEHKIFKSQSELAEALGVKQGNVSTATALASLPKSIISLFQSPLDLTYRMGPALSDLAKAGSDAIEARRRAIKPGMTSKKIFEILSMPEEDFNDLVEGAINVTKVTDEAEATFRKPISLDVKDASGRKLATIHRADGGSVSIKFEEGIMVSDTKLKEIQKLLAAWSTG